MINSVAMNTNKKPFRFGILGAAKIGKTFCEAVDLIENCEVVAVGSRSLERARAFAKEHKLKGAYGSYREMLEKEEIDCAYIAATNDLHFKLTMLCLKYDIPVLCEKAMFANSRQAKEAFTLAREKNIFVMEAMWSRFFPGLHKAREWLREGKIGNPGFMDIGIGFVAPPGDDNRYFSSALGGGAALDILVYAFEITAFFAGLDYMESQTSAIWSGSGVDLTNQVTLRYENMLASLKTSFAVPMGDGMVIYGDRGKIVIPDPHCCKKAYLYEYGKGDEPSEEFHDTITRNGFVYEIEETIRCINDGLIESPIVPHELTIACAKIFDQLFQTQRE